MLKRAKFPDDFQEKTFEYRVRESAVGSSSKAIFWLVGDDVIGSQLHQPSSSNWSMVYSLLVSMLLTSSTWWEFQCLQTAQEHGSDIICSPWRGFQDPWIWWMAKLLLLSVACFPVSPFSHIFCLYLFFGTWGKPRSLKVLYKQEAGGELGGGSAPGMPHRVLSCYRFIGA